TQRSMLSKAGISDEPIPARLGWQPTRDGLRRAWQVTIDDASAPHLWNVAVDAQTGEPLTVADWTSHDRPQDLARVLARPAHHQGPARRPVVSPDPVHDGSSYQVFALASESPNDGPRTRVRNPADAVGSPFGWHDTNGDPEPEYTITRGNNVHAYLDQDNNSAPDYGGAPFEPHGGDVYAWSQAS